MNSRLIEVFKIMSFYDDCRWELSNNKNLINFFRNDLGADVKILTHWFCYITDRQMPFQRIWDIGGFVLSELIYEVNERQSLESLNPDNENSFVVRGNDGDKYTFLSKSEADGNSILAQYGGILEKGRVKFKSRFLPSDYLSILYTFVILEDYDFSFSRFIKEMYYRHQDKSDLITRILFSLYLLTYYEIGQPTSSDLKDFDNNVERASARKAKIKKILSSSDKFNKEYNSFLKNKVFNQKRAWCSFRDFLKSTEFKQYFKIALGEESFTEIEFTRLFSHESLTQLELPGDVWNNSSRFRSCILKDTDYEHSKKALNMILREFFNENRQHIVGYPEQFDITFDFVPRMCDMDNCDLCPIYRISNNDNNFNKICSGIEEMYCPVILVSCNYKCCCKGIESCKIVNGCSHGNS